MPMKFENLRFEVKLFINLYYPLILKVSLKFHTQYYIINTFQKISSTNV